MLFRVHHGRDCLPPTFIGDADHCDIMNQWVQFQRFLDFLRIDFLATGVDAVVAPAQQDNAAVTLDSTPVAGYGVPDAIDGGEGLCRVLVGSRTVVPPLRRLATAVVNPVECMSGHAGSRTETGLAATR